MSPVLDESVSDIEWWFSDYAEFEDFVGIGEQRVMRLAFALKREHSVPGLTINRLLAANGLLHGPRNLKEATKAEGNNNA